MADHDIKSPVISPNLAAQEVILEMAKAGAFNNDTYPAEDKGDDLGACIAAAHKKLADYYRTLEGR